MDLINVPALRNILTCLAPHFGSGIQEIGVGVAHNYGQRDAENTGLHFSAISQNGARGMPIIILGTVGMCLNIPDTASVGRCVLESSDIACEIGLF